MSTNDEKKPFSLVRVFTNTTFDPGAFLGVGTTVYTSGLENPLYFYINVGLVTLAASTRLVTEFKKQGVELPVPELFKRFAENTGAATMVRGGGFAASSVALTLLNDLSDPQNLAKGGVQFLFGAGMFVRGFGMTDKLSSYEKQVLNAIGTATVAAGCCWMALANSAETGLALSMAFAASAGLVIESARKKCQDVQSAFVEKYSIYDLVSASAFATIAVTADSDTTQIANTIYAIGYSLSFPLNRSFGGVYQAGEKLAENVRNRILESRSPV